MCGQKAITAMAKKVVVYVLSIVKIWSKLC